MYIWGYNDSHMDVHTGLPLLDNHHRTQWGYEMVPEMMAEDCVGRGQVTLISCKDSLSL